MSNTVKSFSVEYNPINERNVFTGGDCIKGQIALELAKECKIQSLCVKLKGKAEVSWYENYGRAVVRYHKKEKFFSIKHFIIEAGRGDSIVPRGCHVYPFTFEIPDQDLPSSFKGSYGKIVYKLEANLSRSMRRDSKAKAKFTLIHKGRSDLSLMTPQSGMTEKKIIFPAGTVSMDVNIDRTCFFPGEGMKVVASIQNRSSHKVRPKYRLYMKYSYFVKKKRKLEKKEILKEVGDAVPPSAGLTVTKIITIPPTTAVSILNCNIIKVELRLKVYLDVKYTSDPEIKFPIVLLSEFQQPGEKHQTYGFDVFANSDMTVGSGFLQAPTAFGSFASPTIENNGAYPN